MFIMDVDGVLTDGRIHFGPWPSSAISFDSQDGSGVKYLQRSGIQPVIITGRDSEGVARRAAMLGVEEVAQGAMVKIEAYEDIRRRAGLEDAEIACMGDDLPDIPVMRRAGLAIAVPNAVPEVLELADMVTSKPGGRGAVREAAEFVIKAQGKWEAILARYSD